MRLPKLDQSCCTSFLFCLSVQFVKCFQGLVAPGDKALSDMLGKADSHQPIRKPWMRGIVPPNGFFRLPVDRQLRLFKLLLLPHVLRAELRLNAVREEEFEQKFAPCGFIPGRLLQPLLQSGFSSGRDRVDLALGTSGSLCAALLNDQAFYRQVFQQRIDAAIALIPEMPDAAFDELLDVIARAGLEAKHSKQRQLAG